MTTEPLVTPPPGVDEMAWLAACAAIRAYCGWHIAPSVTEEVTVDGSGGSIQLLPTLHLTNLASITNDGNPVVDPQWSQAGVVRGCWTHKFRGVTATMTHGYDECPVEIAAIIREAASRGVEGSFVSQVGQVRYAGSSGTSGAAAFVGDRAAILDRYKLPPRP